MIRTQARRLLEEMAPVLERHLNCLCLIYSLGLRGELPEAALIAIKSYSQDTGFLEEKTHLLAYNCRKHKPSTLKLVKEYNSKLKSCLLLYWQILEKEDFEVLEDAEISRYLLKLPHQLKKIQKQLRGELPEFFSAAPNDGGQIRNSKFQEQGEKLQGEKPQISNSKFQEAKGKLQIRRGDKDGHQISVGKEPNENLQIPRKEWAGEGGKNLDQLFLAFRIWVEKWVGKEAEELCEVRKNKRGPKGKNSDSTNQERLYHLLKAKVDLFLMKFLDKSHCYWIISEAVGGNEREMAGHIRRTRNKLSKEDPRYDLEGKFPEIDEKYRKKKIDPEDIVVF